MNILAIDTSTKKANVGLKINDFVTYKNIDNEITHSEKLLPLVDDTLKENNLKIKDIDYLACSIGPGSFTGIRIGIATVKAFAKVLNIPVFSASSLDILAYTDIDTSSDYVISVMDAKNSRIYYSVYKIEKAEYNNETIPVLNKIFDYSNDIIDVALDKILDIFKDKKENVASLKIIGDCLDVYKDTFTNKLDNYFSNITTYNSDLSCKPLMQMIENYTKTGINKNFEKDYLTLDAIYVRPSQAERAKNNEL